MQKLHQPDGLAADRRGSSMNIVRAANQQSLVKRGRFELNLLQAAR
jgi:uncharacterized protein YjiS (DUF1127 family)